MAANLITDVPGVRVGSADEPGLASGVTAIVFDEPAVASLAAHGGAPAFRDTALLEPEMTVERVDGFVLSGGSAFGLDAPGGAMAYLASVGRGFRVRTALVPIVPGASLFDLTNGGDKTWGRKPPYWDLGYLAAERASRHFALGTVGAGYGATTFDLKGGLGSASAVTSGGFIVGAIAVANTVGRATRGRTHHFWAAPYERDGEFGGHAFGPHDAEELANAAHEERRTGQHRSGGCRDRRDPHQGPGEAGRDHGAGRLRTGAEAGPRPDGRRRCVRRLDRRIRPRAGASRPHRDRDAGRRMRRPRHRARRLRGDEPRLSRLAARLARTPWRRSTSVGLGRIDRGSRL